MPIDTAAVDRVLGAAGTTFRLARLYPATHPAVQEAMRQITTAIPGLAALGMIEWKIGATGLHWQGQHLLPRNTQVAELAGLLYARGIRVIQLNPGLTADQLLALFGVAAGTLQPDDAALGRITLVHGRRAPVRPAAERPAPAAPPPSPPPQPSPPPAAAPRASGAATQPPPPPPLPRPPPPRALPPWIGPLRRPRPAAPARGLASPRCRRRSRRGARSRCCAPPRPRRSSGRRSRG